MKIKVPQHELFSAIDSLTVLQIHTGAENDICKSVIPHVPKYIEMI